MTHGSLFFCGLENISTDARRDDGTLSHNHMASFADQPPAFDEAVAEAKGLKDLPNEARLQLYGCFKQVWEAASPARPASISTESVYNKIGETGDDASCAAAAIATTAELGLSAKCRVAQRRAAEHVRQQE